VPSFLPHLVGPALVALAFFQVPRRTVLLLAPLVWLPDLDYLVQSQHRAVTHSVLIPVLLLAAVAGLWRRRDPDARFWEFATRPGAPVALSLSAYFLAGHVLMDVFAGGVVLLWPFSWTNYYLAFEILLDTGTNTFSPGAEGGTSEGAPALTPLYPWVSTVDTAIAAFLAATLAAWGAVRAWRRFRGTAPARPVVVRRAATLAPRRHNH
jgi:hypothetical protein